LIIIDEHKVEKTRTAMDYDWHKKPENRELIRRIIRKIEEKHGLEPLPLKDNSSS
jgi:hypothetical protein